MKPAWRRYWPVFVLLALASVVLTCSLLADHFTRELPNYSRIERDLYLGGLVHTPPPGTTAVLNLCESEDPYQSEIHRWEPIRDAEPVPDLDWLRQQVTFIDKQRQAGRVVFVHCRNGISRGAMVTTAYLMDHHDWTRDEALDYLRTRRPDIRPNSAFMRLLLQWERSRKDVQ